MFCSIHNCMAKGHKRTVYPYFPGIKLRPDCHRDMSKDGLQSKSPQGQPSTKAEGFGADGLLSWLTAHHLRGLAQWPECKISQKVLSGGARW